MVTISHVLRSLTRRSRPVPAVAETLVGSPPVDESPAVAETPVAETPVCPPPVAESPAVSDPPAHDDSAAAGSEIIEATLVEYSVPVVVQRPVDRDTSRAEEALYDLVRERVLGMVGPGGTFNVSMRTANDDDLFFSQAFAQLIARELVSQLHASASQPSSAELGPSVAPPAAIGAGKEPGPEQATTHDSRLIA
ncbi:hypothetical protein B0I08_103206 [Glaciihabitans tibetensis]|uniref:Uncharacterized protein n=1 Tax=Glaciihabitans tibetensis TaxID=1266600 RepID=A0A2T0VFL8_9MICO|nr:hypothetical protein [Glaciihabitans tibetensis]PRY69000.1 hypothetical protein B0I08_103206 [Glaciihabitans tibetensis]